MSIWKVKVDHLTLLTCLPLSLSLASELGKETSKPLLDSLTLYILSKFNPKMNWNPAENSDIFGHRSVILHFVKVGYYPLLPLACASI